MMQVQLLLGPIPTPVHFSALFPSFFSSSVTPATSSLFAPSSASLHFSRRYCKPRRRRWDSLVSASSSSSWAAINGETDHYAVLGISRNATSADVKKAYRLLARKYHPDVSKHSQAGELFKKIRNAYEVLSNEVTRKQYDRVLRFHEDNGSSYGRKKYYRPDLEYVLKAYRWAKLRQKMQDERYWEHYNVNEEDASPYDETEEVVEEGNMDQDRPPFSEVLRSVCISLFLLQNFGSWPFLTFSCMMALLDRKLDAGYKSGFLIAWTLGGRGGIWLALCLQFASWVCGKTSSSMVAVVVMAMWVGSNLARYAPIPQGALLTLVYMSLKLHAELK